MLDGDCSSSQLCERCESGIPVSERWFCIERMSTTTWHLIVKTLEMSSLQPCNAAILYVCKDEKCRRAAAEVYDDKGQLYN